MQLMECPAEDDYITSVAWAADGKHVSVGTSSAQVQVRFCNCPSLLNVLPDVTRRAAACALAFQMALLATITGAADVISIMPCCVDPALHRGTGDEG